MQPPAPASSLAEPPPAARPHLGRWICQQGLRSERIRGLLLVLAAAASAAAAASTTTALAFLRLVTFRTGMRILISYSMCTYVVHGFLLPCIVIVVALCNAAIMCALVCVVDLDERQYT